VSEIQEGDKIKVTSKVSHGWKTSECTFLSETEKFITIDYGNYRGTINKYDLKIGKVKIEKIETEESGMKAEAKITKEQLLEECKVHGTGKKACKIISEKHGLTENTIKAYIQRWLTIDERIDIDKSVRENRYSKYTEENKNVKEEVVESTEPEKKDVPTLDIKEITLNGSNGTYRVCKEGIELKSEEQILSFENVQQWEDFKTEIDRVFEYGRSNKILV
jgi:hypothetical protein